ncbi:unnamed protein product, partial [Symbiodinium microadriaticum]
MAVHVSTHRQGTAQSVKVGHRSRSTVRAWGQAALQDTAGAVRVACDSPTAKASREESDVPSGTCLLFRSSTQTGLESAPKAASCVAAYGATRSGETVRSACLARGAAQKLRRSHARTVGADVLWRADGGAECDEAMQLGGLAATPDLGPK